MVGVLVFCNIKSQRCSRLKVWNPTEAKTCGQLPFITSRALNRLYMYFAYHSLYGRWRCFKSLSSYLPCPKPSSDKGLRNFSSLVKFKKLLMMPRTADAYTPQEHENDRFENSARMRTDAKSMMRHRESKNANLGKNKRRHPAFLVASISSLVLQNSLKVHDF
jgi:hypothetical protein